MGEQPEAPASAFPASDGAALASGARAELQRISGELGLSDRVVPFDLEQGRQLAIYLETLLFWRERLSLISVAQPEQIFRAHIVDSLALVPWVEPNAWVADIGSGGGFPGIPLAIACPASRFVLIESRRKRTSFLSEVARKAGLKNVEVFEGRAEDCAKGVHQSRFDLIVSRAVGDDAELLRLATPLARPGCGVALMRSGRQVADLATTAEVRHYRLPDGEDRSIVTYTL